MKLHINPKDGMPLYRQIMDQVKYLIAAGRLRPGDDLPTVRGLAQDLLINPNTVGRAYRELEQAGILNTRHGAGTVVSGKGTPLSRSECERILTEKARLLVTESHHLGFSLDDTLEVVRSAYNMQRETGKEHKQ